jgi:uncharacterized lipoprotein YbaY
MKLPLCFFAFGVCALFQGCTQLAMSPLEDNNRVVTGTVTFTEPATLPADARVTVRVLDTSQTNGVSKIIADQLIKGGGPSPIAFKIEFRAEQALLQRGLNIEARVDFDGKVQLFNGNSYAVTVGNISAPHEIAVEKISR